MKLSITRTQSKSMMGGGVNFEVKVRLIPTDEERNLINHYKLANEVVTISNKKSAWTGRLKDVKIKDVVDGTTFKAKDLGEVIGYTETVVAISENLMQYLEVARKFGGEEILEVHLPKDDD